MNPPLTEAHEVKQSGSGVYSKNGSSLALGGNGGSSVGRGNAELLQPTPSPIYPNPSPSKTTQNRSGSNTPISTQPGRRPEMTAIGMRLEPKPKKTKIRWIPCCTTVEVTHSPHEKGPGLPLPPPGPERPVSQAMEKPGPLGVPDPEPPVPQTTRERRPSGKLSEAVALRPRTASQASYVSLPGMDQPRSRKGSQGALKEGASGSRQPRSRTTSLTEPRSRKASQVPPPVPPMPQ